MKPKPKSTPAKKLGASRVGPPTGAKPEAFGTSFGDFDFADDDPPPASNGGAPGGGRKAFSGDDWGWDGASPVKDKPVAAAAPPVDDPWADAGRPPASSLFAYDCASLHATAPSEPPNSNKPAGSKPRSLFDSVGVSADSGPTSDGAGTRDGFADDPYGSFARDKFAGASSISSSNFAAALPRDEPADNVDPAAHAAQEAADKERRLQELGMAGASGFGSSDLEGPQSPGKARQIAGASIGAARAVGGYAASLGASILSRAQSSPTKGGSH